MERENISSGTEWESKVGYSRVVRTGNQVFISGTTATDDEGGIVGIDNPYKQTIKTLDNIESSLNEAGARISDVVKTRIYVTNIDLEDWIDEVGRAHSEYFDDIRPATVMVEVERLVHPDMLVEIEAEAVMTNG